MQSTMASLFFSAGRPLWNGQTSARPGKHWSTMHKALFVPSCSVYSQMDCNIPLVSVKTWQHIPGMLIRSWQPSIYNYIIYGLYTRPRKAKRICGAKSDEQKAGKIKTSRLQSALSVHGIDFLSATPRLFNCENSHHTLNLGTSWKVLPSHPWQNKLLVAIYSTSLHLKRESWHACCFALRSKQPARLWHRKSDDLWSIWTSWRLTHAFLKWCCVQGGSSTGKTPCLEIRPFETGMGVVLFTKHTSLAGFLSSLKKKKKNCRSELNQDKNSLARHYTIDLMRSGIKNLQPKTKSIQNRIWPKIWPHN